MKLNEGDTRLKLKPNEMVLVVVYFALFLGWVAGPIIWALGANYHNELEEYQAKGTATKGFVVSKYIIEGPESSSFYIDVLYTRSGRKYDGDGELEYSNELYNAKASDHNVSGSFWYDLDDRQDVDVYYIENYRDPSLIVVAQEYDEKYMGFYNNTTLGMVLTLSSYAILIFLIIRFILKRGRKKRTSQYVRYMGEE